MSFLAHIVAHLFNEAYDEIKRIGWADTEYARKSKNYYMENGCSETRAEENAKNFALEMMKAKDNHESTTFRKQICRKYGLPLELFF